MDFFVPHTLFQRMKTRTHNTEEAEETGIESTI